MSNKLNPSKAYEEHSEAEDHLKQASPSQDSGTKQDPLKVFSIALIVVILCSPIWFLLNHLGRTDMALPAAIAVAVFIITILVCRDLLSQIWFWVAILVFAALHVPLLLYMPWTFGRIPAAVMLPFAIIDLVAYLAIISLTKKQMKKRKT